MKRQGILVLAAAIAAICTIFLRDARYGEIMEAAAAGDRMPSKAAPDFELSDINNNTVRLSDFKNKVIILDFWAAWCPPCKAEIPHFVSLYSQYKDRGLEIIGVVFDVRAKDSLKGFIEEKGMNYTVLLADERVGDLYGGIVSIPTTFIIDRDGNIRKKYIGYREKEIFEKDIEELL